MEALTKDMEFDISESDRKKVSKRINAVALLQSKVVADPGPLSHGWTVTTGAPDSTLAIGQLEQQRSSLFVAVLVEALSPGRELLERE